MKAKLFLCADSAVIDARQTTLSAFHILEETASAGFPFVIPRVAVLSILIREENDPPNPPLQIIVQLGEEILLQSPFGVEFQDRNFFRSIGELHNLLIMAPGPLRFILKTGETQIAEWVININLLGNPEVDMREVGNPAEHRQPATEPVAAQG